VYEYSRRNLDQLQRKQESSISIEAHQNLQSPKDYDAIQDSIAKTMDAMPPGSSCKPHKSTKNPAPKEVSPEEQEKHDWIKDVKALQGSLHKDQNIFRRLRVDANPMQQDKTSGVTRELVNRLQAAQAELMNKYEELADVLALAGNMKPDNFHPDNSKVDKARAVLDGYQALKTRALRIVGK